MTSIARSPVLRIPRAGGGTPWSAIHFAAASMLLVRYRIWNGPGPRRKVAAVVPGYADVGDVEPDGRVRVDAGLEIGDGDRYGIDAGGNGCACCRGVRRRG